MITKPAHKNKGFSLVEVLVFVSVLAVALVALIGTTAYSSIILNNARHKLFSVRYAEELAEWLKFQREYYLYNALEAKSSEVGKTYCFNNSNLPADGDTWPQAGQCQPPYGLQDFYQRQLFLKTETGEKISAEITCSYFLLNKARETKIKLYFNQYDL